MMILRFFLKLLLSALLLFTPSAHANNPAVFTAIIENDKFRNTDRAYTNGVRFSYVSAEEKIPDFTRQQLFPHLTSLLKPEGKKRVSYALGQNIYTPGDINNPNPSPKDQPYAGWLYGSFGLLSDTGKTLSNLVLTIGAVGPASQAEKTQTFVHHIIKENQPEGWNHQLKNEPGVNLAYERNWREVFAMSDGIGFDIIPHARANLGNISTSASVGATFRLGRNLPSDYGPPRIRLGLPGSDFFIPSPKLAGYFFTSLEGSAVARNIFLDGNTFHNGPHVRKKPFIGSFQFGFAVTYKDLRITYTQVTISKEYDSQQGLSKFGGVTVSWIF